MTYAPQTLQDLGAYWKRHGGVLLGIVGNTAHTRGYHLGKDRIYDGSGPGQGSDDYSVQHRRDKAGLTNAASAIDLGRLDGSLARLRSFSRDLVERCMADAAVRKDVREVIYSPDGQRVQRYSGEDNKIHTGPGNGDDSHRTHTHISWWRDSEKRDKRPVFAPYFADAPAPPAVEDPPMPTLTSYIPGAVATVKATANVRSAPRISPDTLLRVVPKGSSENWTVTGWCKGDTDPESGSAEWLTRWSGGRWEYTAKGNLSAGPAAPPDGSPFTKADVDAAAATGARQGFNNGLAAAASAVAAVPRK